MIFASLQPDAFQKHFSPFMALAGRKTAHVEIRQLDILDRGRTRQEIEVLKDEPEFPVADMRKFARRAFRNLCSVKKIRPLRRHVKAPEDVEHCRLSRAGRAHDGDKLTLVD